MLTADHVDARRRNGELLLQKLDARARREATELAQLFLDDAREHIGKTRDELEEAWESHDVGTRGKLAAGLRKLIEDACELDEELPVDPVLLRQTLFERAAAERRAGRGLAREAVVAEVARAMGFAPEATDKLLFADRRGSHVLRGAPLHFTAASLVESYEMGRAQAILLKASRVTCVVDAPSPGLLRAFFAKLKFHGLLFTVERESSRSFKIVLDGPFSMFESVTKYGLKLALVLPALRDLERWTLEADIRWGKTRESLIFKLSSGDVGAPLPPPVPDAIHLSDDVRGLLRDLGAAGGSLWRPAVAAAILDVPGLGVVVPDLVLEREGHEPVYVEVLGFWSRDAVWRRVELAKAGGLGARIVFCANARLRVSEAVLDAEDHAALYVWKGKLSARALLERVERLHAARETD